MSQASGPALPAAVTTLGQLVRSEKDTVVGARLCEAFEKCALKSALGTANILDAAQQQMIFLMLKTSAEDQEHLRGVLAHGLPYFVRTELIGNMALLRPFQRTFWNDSMQAWNPGPGQEVAKRLLMVAATGTGKSAIIAIAPFAGARDRNLVVVPNLTILEGLCTSLGAVDPGDESEEAGETIPPVLQKLGLLGQADTLPRVLVLNDLPKKRKSDGRYVYPKGEKPRPLVEIILDYDVVLTTAQTLVAEKKMKKSKKRKSGDADGDDGDDEEFTEVEKSGKLTEMVTWIHENQARAQRRIHAGW
jgi:hypothetical protein